MMAAYSLLLLLALTLSAPWWLTRMLTTSRYREGLPQRLGRVHSALRDYARGHRIVWVHAVSVGEVLAATRLVSELEATLRSQRDDRFRIVISTTTRTGQALARQRFGASSGAARVFYYPLDLGFAVRSYLDALRPEALILMESELWPRMLHECGRRNIPVAVVNARVSDRSFARAQRFRAIWSRLLRRVTLFLAQSPQDAARLIALGADERAVQVSGNLKYDVTARPSALVSALRPLLEGRRLIVGGSLLETEEMALLDHWWTIRGKSPEIILVLAPRHPERFEAVAKLAGSGAQVSLYRATELQQQIASGELQERFPPMTVLLLDTIGDLAAMYELATVAFVGGSLVPRGGHNPLEPAQFGVPVVMGPSFENFRDIVAKMQAAEGIRIVPDAAALQDSLTALLTDEAAARELGERGQQVFAAEAGATARSVAAIAALLGGKP